MKLTAIYELSGLDPPIIGVMRFVRYDMVDPCLPALLCNVLKTAKGVDAMIHVIRKSDTFICSKV